MKNLVVAYISRPKYPSDLPRLFCSSSSDLIKGIVVEFKESYLERQMATIDKPNGLTLNELHQKMDS